MKTISYCARYFQTSLVREMNGYACGCISCNKMTRRCLHRRTNDFCTLRLFSAMDLRGSGISFLKRIVQRHSSSLFTLSWVTSWCGEFRSAICRIKKRTFAALCSVLFPFLRHPHWQVWSDYNATRFEVLYGLMTLILPAVRCALRCLLRFALRSSLLVN